MYSILAIIAATSILGTQLPSDAGANLDSGTIVNMETTTTSLLQVGDTIEDFTIPTPYSPSQTEEVSLGSLLEDGPVVLSFFRGSWCHYCRGELSSLQDRLNDFEEVGAQVLAISPELPEDTVEFGEKEEYGFYIGHDENNDLARELGLTFKLDAKTIKAYRSYKINVPKSNGTKKWELPIPATYVIDQDFTVKFVFDTEDYSKRANYKKVLKVVKELQAED